MTPAPVAFDLAALDIAGTTVDEGGLVYEVLGDTVADAAGTAVPGDVLARWKGTSKREAIAGVLRELGANASTTAVDAAFQDFTHRLVVGYRETPPRPFPGVLETLRELRARGVRVVLQTGYDAQIADSILAGLGWEVGSGDAAVVDAVVSTDMVLASRPAPYLVFRSMEAAGCTDVRRVLVAGDTPNDLGAGTNAGAGFVVGVGTGSFTLEQLGQHPHTHLVASCADLPTLL